MSTSTPPTAGPPPAGPAPTGPTGTAGRAPGGPDRAGPPVRLAAPGRWLVLVAALLLTGGGAGWVLAGGRLAELLP